MWSKRLRCSIIFWGATRLKKRFIRGWIMLPVSGFWLFIPQALIIIGEYKKRLGSS